ncbi:hypothetical protein F4779DRAFT_593029 [Xylariaceae sp. FL0662B]|nr:hypothetical protein F4779DRAFT_593029 [Xylariaceae sp. FL0662B]
MVLQAVAVPRSLDSLPARPPTPPREKQRQFDPSSKQILADHTLNSHTSLHTPPSHSPDSADTNDNSSRRARKRVGFSTRTEYRDAPIYADKENALKQPTPISAPASSASLKPIKSILKATSSPEPPNPLDPSAANDEATRHANIAIMLESAVKQLAGADRTSKIDAYTMLVRSLKVSNNLPDRIALQDKMSLFMQFIQRDITLKGPNGNLDSSLVNHALTLLCTFLHFPAIASTLSSDFDVFIVDHCIRSFEDRSMPKDVIRHLMQVVAFQDFPPKVMTSDRVGRLVNSLHKIEEHLKGKSIIMSRILIYRRLIKQTRSHMATHSDWLLDLFTDMLSSMKEIRAAAIGLGLEASLTVGKEKQLSRRVMEILQLSLEDTKYIEYYVERLMAMTRDKNDSAVVPQVWSVVILLLRCPVDRWEFFQPWLEIIQRCFNSSDYHTKVEANYAWNRLVYALQLNEQSFSKTIGTVCQPFLSQFKRKGNSKQLDELRKVVVGSVCNLYYYAFKPNLSSSQTDSYWDACVRPLLQRLVNPEADNKQLEKPTATHSENIAQATLILTGLFNSTTLRIWKEDRVYENPLVGPEELPGLDPKWVRRNSMRVFFVVEPILVKTFADLSQPQSISYNLWQTLVSAVATAASKEVKVSTDTATFVAHAFSLLVKIWSFGLGESNCEVGAQQRFLDATEAYLVMMIDSLGLLPFTEKLLSMNKQNAFVPVATPSHRAGKAQGLTRTPLHHLFSILATIPPGISDDEGLLSLINAVFDPFLVARSSQGRSDLAHELMQIIPAETVAPYGPWVFLAELISSSLENSQPSHSSNTSGSGPTIGHEYREIVRHLEKGVKFIPNLPWDQWQSLFQLLVARTTYEAGEAGCAIAVVEPLAKTFLEGFPTTRDDVIPPNYFKSGIELVATARQPRDRQALDAARRRLWGTPIAGSRSASFDPYGDFYHLTNHLLEISYMRFEHYDQDIFVVPLLTEVASFLMRCNRLLVFKALVYLQPGIGLWIQDANARYGQGRKQSLRVSEEVKTLFDRICGLFLDTGSLENFQLDTIEPLLCSAFQSKHRHVVNAVSALWNRAFEQVEEIQYPDKLKTVLLSLQPYIDVVLPGLDVSSHQCSGQAPSFIESQDDLEAPSLPSVTTGRRSTPRVERAPSRRSATPASVQLSLSAKRQRDATPSSSRPRSARRSATPKPRYDDSQIQFAAIQSSSPSNNAMESQLLTDRQKEVRERQRENAALFPNICSSIEKTKSGAQSPILASLDSDIVQPSQQARAATPEHNRTFEDFVSSTPTPRRGQAPIIDDDHDMTDVSSSPPEPRRNLLAEMKPRSRSNSMLHEFPISSSPISGSPVPNRQALPANQIPPEQEDAEATQNDMVDPIHNNGLNKDAELKPERSPMNASDGSYKHEPERPVTPPNTRSLKQGLATPRSDEVFVDALTSPAPRSPRTLRSNAPKGQEVRRGIGSMSEIKGSFEVSDGEERSMARLVVELDSRKCEPLPRYDTISPEKPPETGGPTLECITVNTGSNRFSANSKKGQNSQPSSAISSTPVETDSSQPSSKKSRKKRKRTSDKSQDSSSKKGRYRKYMDAADVDSVPDSQMPPANANALSQDITSHAAELNALSTEQMELDVDLGSSSSHDSAKQEPTTTEPPPEESIIAKEDDNNALERESEAVNLQIMAEASQQSEMELTVTRSLIPGNTDVNMIDEADEADEDEEGVEEAAETGADVSNAVEKEPAAKSALERIMGALQDGLEGLRTATLSRDEVNQIEDMFFDIKKELYQAESRSRR